MVSVVNKMNKMGEVNVGDTKGSAKAQAVAVHVNSWQQKLRSSEPVINRMNKWNEQTN